MPQLHKHFNVVRYLMMKLSTVIFSLLILPALSSGQEVVAKTSNLCDTPKLTNKFPSFSNIPQYFDYQQAIDCQGKSKKPLLIYFTAKFSANSRKIEKDVLSDTSVIRLLKDFIIVALYVDDEEVGKGNSAVQETKYKGLYTPQFIIQPFLGEWKSMIGYTSKEAFTNFIHP
jgi:hypothetical protein